MQKKEVIVNIFYANITQVYSAKNAWLKYNLYLNLINNDKAIDLRLQSIKKYSKDGVSRHSYLSDFFPTFIIFIIIICNSYDQKI